MFVKTLILTSLLLLVTVVPAGTHGNFFLGPPNFLELYDGPPEQSYDGQAGKGIVVNPLEDGYIYSSVTGTGASFYTGVDNIVTASGEVVVASGNVVTTGS